jgi:hypothetical protein
LLRIVCQFARPVGELKLIFHEVKAGDANSASSMTPSTKRAEGGEAPTPALGRVFLRILSGGRLKLPAFTILTSEKFVCGFVIRDAHRLRVKLDFGTGSQGDCAEIH